MNSADFKLHRDNLIEESRKIMDAKQPEYTKLSADVLISFKDSARNLDVTPLTIWAVFMDKHMNSILTHVKNPGMEKAEPIETRFYDLYNYVTLGYALLKESQDNPTLI